MLHFLVGLLIVAILLSFTAGRWLVGLFVLGGVAFVGAILINGGPAKVSQVAAPVTAPPPINYEPYVIPSGRQGEPTAAQQEVAHAMPTPAEDRGRSQGRRVNESAPKRAHDLKTPEFVFDDAAEAARVRAIEAALPKGVAPVTAQQLLLDALPLPAASLDFDKCAAGPRGHHCRAY